MYHHSQCFTHTLLLHLRSKFRKKVVLSAIFLEDQKLTTTPLYGSAKVTLLKLDFGIYIYIHIYT